MRTLSRRHAVKIHYNDVIMCATASQITSPTIVYSRVYSGADQRKRLSSASLAFVRGIHRWPVNSPHKRPITREMFPFDDVIMMRFFLHDWLGILPLINLIANHLYHCSRTCVTIVGTLGYHQQSIVTLSEERKEGEQETESMREDRLFIVRYNPLVSAWTVRHSSTYIILYIKHAKSKNLNRS